MKYFIILISYLLLVLSSVESLVHYTKFPAGANGCKIDDGDVEVGGMKDNPNVCGVYVCQNKEGDTLIHYCQRPATFADCPKGCTGVSTIIPFPQCCWICVEYVDCDSGANSTGATDTSPQGGETTTTDSSGTTVTTEGTAGTTGSADTTGTAGTADTTESTESTVSTDTSPGEDAETTKEAADETSTEAPQEK